MADKIISRADALAQGLKRYFTGKPCKRGHLSERGTASFACLVCARDETKRLRDLNPDAERKRQNEWREKNRERLREQENSRKAVPGEKRDKRLARRREWRQENNERIRAQELESRRENPEKHRDIAKRHYWKDPVKQRERFKEWRNSNPEVKKRYYDAVGRQKNKEYRDSHKDELKEYYSNYQRDNKEQVYANIHKRRALKKASQGSYTAEDIALILIAQDHHCPYCNADLKQVKRHIDHIMPLSRGGGNDKTNIQVLCQTCNLAKGDKDPIEYERSIGLRP